MAVKKRCSMKLVLLLFICSFSALAQQKTSNNDLRKFYNLFQIKDLKSKQAIEYKMNTSGKGQFNLELLNKAKVVQKSKVNSKQAQTLDEQFVDKFISFKYLMNPTPDKGCKDQFYLNLRGEELVICENEKDKIKQLNAFLEQLKVLFS